MFSVVFQHRIPKCISLILILCCGQTRVREYFSVVLRSKVVFVRFSESDSFRFKLSESESFTLQFPIIPLCPWSSQFPVFFLIHTILCLGLEGSRNPSLTKERSDWQLSFSSSSLSPLPLFSNYSSCSFSTCLSLSYFSFFSSLCFSPSVSFSNCPFVTLSFVLTLSSVPSLVLTPTQSLMFSLFLHPSPALRLSFTDNLPRVASIHLSAPELSTPFLTQKPQRRKS